LDGLPPVKYKNQFQWAEASFSLQKPPPWSHSYLSKMGHLGGWG
jgi:hypothetical protein